MKSPWFTFSSTKDISADPILPSTPSPAFSIKPSLNGGLFSIFPILFGISKGA